MTELKQEQFQDIMLSVFNSIKSEYGVNWKWNKPSINANFAEFTGNIYTPVTKMVTIKVWHENQYIQVRVIESGPSATKIKTFPNKFLVQDLIANKIAKWIKGRIEYILLH